MRVEIFSEHFMMSLALFLPFLQALVQLCVIAISSSLYVRLKRVNLFFGVSSGSVLAAVLLFWERGSLPQELSLFNFQFALTNMGLIFWSVKTVILCLAEIFSLRYLFQEPGMGKFYFVISLFSFSLNLVFLSDSFTLFTLGWELMGLTSVILIAFFDRRRAAVERSFLTFLFYKMGDFFLLTALFYLTNIASIHSFGEVERLAQMKGASLILCLFVLATFVKSGLLPFSFWLPRAMEGPTPSSALFYGALSSHAGLFLLMRILNAGGHMTGMPLILLLGGAMLTALFAYLMALTRSDIKSQIVYSTLCQISVIFIEIGCGLKMLALVHSILHMVLRFFQFLLAPSAIYLAHEKDFLGGALKSGHSEHEATGGEVRPLGILRIFGPRGGDRFNGPLLHWVWWLSLHEFCLKIFWRQVVLEPLLRLGQSFQIVQRWVRYGVVRFSRWTVFLRPTTPLRKDMIQFFFFLIMISLPVVTEGHITVSFVGVLLCQGVALGFSLLSIQEKRLSRSFFNLIFSGTFLTMSYYYAIVPGHIQIFYAHFFASAFGFSMLAGLFIFFRNAFDLPDGHDFFGLNRISPILSGVFSVLILFVLGFPGFSTYFSFELLSADLSSVSAFATISGLAILNVNAYLWFNIYARLFWGAAHDFQAVHISDL